MNRTRWKMMIGALGLSLGGLAAVAGVPASDGMVSCSGAPAHTVARVSEPTTPAPKLADLPTLPGVPTPPAPRPIEVPAPTPPAVPTPAAPEPTPLPPVIPAVPPAKPAVPVYYPPEPSFPQLPESPAVPEPIRIKPVGLPVVEKPPELPPVPKAFPAPKAELPQLPTPVAFAIAESPPAPVPAPALAPAPTAVAVDTAKVAERKLKVILSMGDERPRFEVRDGDEIYLKVVCDRVEVKSPGEAGVTVSTMSATGKVTFVTPGGEGTCDQLAVLPGTGQVVVTGKVTFTYNWGKVETTVTGEKMNFRLGSNTLTPSATQGGVTGVPASYTRPR